MTTRPVHLIYMHFNSRLRKETNINFDIDMARYLIFQLTSPQGDELCLISTIGLFYIFQFASPQGDEPNYHDLMIIQDHFNSRLRKETNVVIQLCNVAVFISTHVSARRRTVCHLSCGIRAATFQFTSL